MEGGSSADIDKEHGFGKGPNRYLYNRLTVKGIIKRITISIENTTTSYLSLLFLEDLNHKPYSNEYGYMKSCINTKIFYF